MLILFSGKQSFAASESASHNFRFRVGYDQPHPARLNGPNKPTALSPAHRTG